MSNGYSKLANYHLGGSGFQVESRVRQTHEKIDQQLSNKKIQVNNRHGKRCTKSTKNCNNQSSQEEPSINGRSRTVSEGLSTIPKSIFNNFFSNRAKLSKYGQLHTPNTITSHPEHDNERSSHISVLDENVSNNSVKGM